MKSLSQLADRTVLEVWGGVVGRAIEGERITLGVLELEPNCVVPQHEHANEQLGICLEGQITFTMEGETQTLGPGGMWRILGGVPHQATAGPEGAVVIDVFSPPREDWHALRTRPASRPRWPR
jgi:quercetin dioxygenase-like cupin family protein